MFGFSFEKGHDIIVEGHQYCHVWRCEWCINICKPYFPGRQQVAAAQGRKQVGGMGSSNFK